MKTILAFTLLAITIQACVPGTPPPDGLDAATDASVVTDAAPEVSSDALPPHVDGGGID